MTRFGPARSCAWDCVNTARRGMRDCNDVDWRGRPPRSRDRRVSKMSKPVVKARPMIDLEEFERRLRKPLAANQGDDDPLAELARFVGEQEDPYQTVFEPLSRRPAGTLRRGPDHGGGEEPGAHEPLIGGDFAAIEAGLLGAARRETGENLSLAEEVD